MGDTGRKVFRLNAVGVRSEKKRGLYHDGGGLYLQVSENGSKSWIFRYSRARKARSMGLGPYPLVGLVDARTKAVECRRCLLDGRDPIDERRSSDAENLTLEKRSTTFKQCATSYIEINRLAWKNAKHAQQWVNTLSQYAYPVIGHIPVHMVDTDLVMKIVSPIWTTKNETADRVRNRIELILDMASARGYRTGDNPARMRGHLNQLLPRRSKIKTVRNFPALHYEKLEDFLKELGQRSGIAARALEFQILTATRSGETMNARFDEIDFERALWTIPPIRMKSGREQRVPLSAPALSIVAAALEMAQNEFIFPGYALDKPLSNGAFTPILKKIGSIDPRGQRITAHGFRSTFKDWATECTAFPREVVEAALAHSLRDKVEAAYRRGDLLEKRTELMRQWGAFCIPFQLRSSSNNQFLNKSRVVSNG